MKPNSPRTHASGAPVSDNLRDSHYQAQTHSTPAAAAMVGSRVMRESSPR